MDYIYDDGGRSAAGYKGSASDCVCRSIAIAAQMPYEEVYQRLASGTASQRAGRRGKRARSARNGINTKRKWFKEYMELLGFDWFPCMGIGTGCKVHLADEELPYGRLVVAVSKHYTAVIDNTIRDTYNPSRAGNRCVYGYWKLA